MITEKQAREVVANFPQLKLTLDGNDINFIDRKGTKSSACFSMERETVASLRALCVGLLLG